MRIGLAEIREQTRYECTELAHAMIEESRYICGGCGEEIVVPIDVSQGSNQEYVEDCPVCCQANVISLEIDGDGNVTTEAELE